MKTQLKKAFMSAVFAVGAIGGGWGAYAMVNTASREFITQKDYYNDAKNCIEQQRISKACNADDYAKVAVYVDTKKKYATGLSFMFGGMSMVKMGLPFVPPAFIPVIRRRKNK